MPQIVKPQWNRELETRHCTIMLGVDCVVSEMAFTIDARKDEAVVGLTGSLESKHQQVAHPCRHREVPLPSLLFPGGVVNIAKPRISNWLKMDILPCEPQQLFRPQTRINRYCRKRPEQNRRSPKIALLLSMAQ